MCGIAGILRFHPEPAGDPDPAAAIPPPWLAILDDAVRHRGPDGHGIIRDRVRTEHALLDVALVHRRLSILDHEGGAQPMLRTDAGRTVALVFNGCIYNHRQLRAELARAGHTFRTDHSDTEALLEGWRRWGRALPTRLDGMYAAAIWDGTEPNLTLMRDLAGEKPLYVLRLPERNLIAFSSVPAGLIRLAAHVGERPAVDAAALALWIRDGYADRPPIAGIEEVPPGATITLYPEGVEPVRRVLTERNPNAPPLTAERVDGMLARAVGSRLEADVPVGCFLSGGVDSALVTLHAVRAAPDVRAFTVRMPGPEYDESDRAAAIASAIGARHTVLDCHPDPGADLLALIRALGLPFADSSLLPSAWVSRAARAEVGVALSGDGADELFCGYERHVAARYASLWRPALRLIPPRALPARRPRGRSAKLRRLAEWSRTGVQHAIFDESTFRSLFPDALWSNPDAAADEPRRDFESYLPGDLLRKTDTASMAAPIELRAPFLDREIVGAALSAPIGTLMPGSRRKGLLKQVARLHLPAALVDGPKRGFAIPVGDWLRTPGHPLRELTRDTLGSPDPMPGLPFQVDSAALHRLMDEHARAGDGGGSPWRGRDHGQRLYALLVTSLWLRWLAETPAAPQAAP